MTTTKLVYKLITEIDYESLSYNPDDPEPLPDGMYQFPALKETISILGNYLDKVHGSGGVFSSSNTFICYDPNNLNVRVGPDFYVAIGVDALAITSRQLYLPWEAGKPPDFVLEVASETTARRDVGLERDIYARIGVPEYWRFDGTGGEHYGEPLAGDRLVEGSYRPFDLTHEPDGVLKAFSPVLDLSICWRDEMIAFYDHRTDAYLLDLGGEQAARAAAEARVRELEEELRRLRG